MSDRSPAATRTKTELMKGRQAIMKLLLKPDEIPQALVELSSYQTKEGILADPSIWETASRLPAWEFWKLNCGHLVSVELLPLPYS